MDENSYGFYRCTSTCKIIILGCYFCIKSYKSMFTLFQFFNLISNYTVIRQSCLLTTNFFLFLQLAFGLIHFICGWECMWWFFDFFFFMNLSIINGGLNVLNIHQISHSKWFNIKKIWKLFSWLISHEWIIIVWLVHFNKIFDFCVF